MAGNDSGPNYWDPSVMQPALSPAEKALREKFVEEYLLDYDAINAAIRTGLMERVAVSLSFQFLREPFVLKLIKEKERQRTALDPDLEEAENQALRSKLWAEANYMGPGASHGARVAALSKLCNIRGLDGVKKVSSEVTHRGGVMIVPAIATNEDWEEEASKSQSHLMSEARH